MARFYANENFPYPVVAALRSLGHDVLTVQETGKGEQSVADEGVLHLASEDARAVLTVNRKHFIQLHNRLPDHRGIVVCTFDPDFEGQAKRIHDAIASLASVEGRLIRVNRPQS